MLELVNISKTYAASGVPVSALDGVSLTVAAGEFVAVKGPSGCGKSTLLLTCGALLHPDGGSIRLNGDDLYAGTADSRAANRARHIGFVFQQFHLVPYLTLRENVLAAALPLKGADADDTADGLIERFGLADRATHLPGSLSVGERQRVALARALLNHPCLLLADEPTGNLDPANAAVVFDALAAFAQEGGCVLMVTHDATAARRADTAYHMTAGQLVKD